MTNKEKYKQACSVLHTSDISEGEVKYMAKLKNKYLSPAVEQFSKFIIENCDSKEKIETKNIY